EKSPAIPAAMIASNGSRTRLTLPPCWKRNRRLWVVPLSHDYSKRFHLSHSSSTPLSSAANRSPIKLLGYFNCWTITERATSPRPSRRLSPDRLLAPTRSLSFSIAAAALGGNFHCRSI